MRNQDIYFHTAPVSECLPVMNNMIPIRPHVSNGGFLFLPRIKLHIDFFHIHVHIFKCTKTTLHVFNRKGKVEGW